MKKILGCLTNKKMWGTTFLLCFLVRVDFVFGAEQGGLYSDPGDPRKDSLRRVAAIQIIPYNPLAASSNDREVQEVLAGIDIPTELLIDEYHREPYPNFEGNRQIKYSATGLTDIKPNTYGFPSQPSYPTVGTYKDHFGFGRNSVYHVPAATEFICNISYATQETSAAITARYSNETHGYYLQQLALYKQNNFKDYDDDKVGNTKTDNAKRNLLLVRMRINAVSDMPGEIDQPYEYIFGIFASGVTSFLTKAKPTIGEVGEAIVSSLKKTTQFDQFPSNSFSTESIKDLLIRSGHYLDGEFYKIKTFPIIYNGQEQRLALSCRKQDDLIATIQSRFFLDDPYRAITLEDCARASEVRSRFTARMFGRSAYCHFVKETGDDKVCFIDDVDFCFCQSEQLFMSFLEDADENEKPLFYGSVSERAHELLGRALPRDVLITAKEIRIDMYSTLDICRYCRGTFSHILQNNRLKRTLDSFFKRRGVNGLNINDATLTMYAFSNNQTNTR